MSPGPVAVPSSPRSQRSSPSSSPDGNSARPAMIPGVPLFCCRVAEPGGATMTPAAEALARWAADLEPGPDALALADRALLDTVAVALAARDHPVTTLAAGLPEGARWARAGHGADFADLPHAPTAP